MAVLLSQNMLDLEVVELRDATASLLVKGTKFGAVHPILPLHLLDHKLRVGDYPQAPVAVGDSKFQRGKECGVLGKVIGMLAQILGQFGQALSRRVLDVDAEAGRPWVAARPAVAIGDN